MKLKIIIENTVFQSDAKAELGFCLYIETEDNHKILFDIGQTDLFAYNAQLFDIDINEIDSLVLSHGHYDHTGGIEKFLQLNNHADIYIKEGYDTPKFNKIGKYIGVPTNIHIPQDRLHITKEITKIAEGIYIIPNIKIYDARETHFTHLTVRDGDNLKEDSFEDEQFLVIQKNNKLSLVSGCAHRGIVNTIQSAIEHFDVPIDLVIGGFHTLHEDEQTIRQLANKLNQLSIDRIITCHCTGIDQYAQLKNEYKGNIQYGHVGLNTYL